MKYNKKTMHGIYKRIVGAMSGLSYISVEIKDNVTPCFDIKKNLILMPEAMPFAENDDEDFNFSRGTLVHESTHVLFAPDITNMCRAFEDSGICPKDLFEWFNVFADLNNEYKGAMVFPTLRKPLADKTEALFKKKPDMLKTDNPFMQVLMRCDKLAKLEPTFPEGYHPDLVKFVEHIVGEFNKGKIESCKGKELVRFTRDTFNKWRELCKQHEQGNSEFQKAMDKLRKQLGNAIKSGDSLKIGKIEKEIEEKSKDGSHWFKNRNVVSREAKAPQINFSEEDLDKLREIVRKKSEAEQKEKNSNLSKMFQGTTGELIKQGRPSGVGDDEYDKEEAILKGKSINRKLKNRIKLQEDFESKHKTGDSIDLEEVSRQVAKAGRIYKPNIFQRRNTFTRGGEWAIEVMCDCSGSMKGSNMQEAKQALATLAYALNGLPNVHYALTGFIASGRDEYTEFQIKKFNERALKTKYLESLDANGGTPIEVAVKMSARRLIKFKNIKKILVVITDGCGNIDKTTENVGLAERMHIKVLGIGIGSDKISESFRNHYLYKDASKLDVDLTKLILDNLNDRKATKLVKRAWEQ